MEKIVVVPCWFEAGMHLTLTVTEGPHRGVSFRFASHETFLVGRAPAAHFSLPEKDPYFSRLHFLIEINPPLCRLMDLKSRNGTRVNGQRVAVADLKNGDRIQAGHTVLQVAMEGSPTDMLSAMRPSAELPAQTLDLPAVEPTPVDRGTIPPTAFPEQPSFPGYQLLRELGRGGMGVVYLARKEPAGALVALKTILPAVKANATLLARFLREAEILRQLQHRHIVAFQDMGQTDGLLYFAMDYVPGTDAEKLLRDQGPLPVGRAVDWICQTLDGLAYAHQKGFVHRDLKPGNLLISQAEGHEVVQIADFGLARTYQASALSGLTMTGSSGGTPSFMPPEQVTDFRCVKPAADQYAAAATLYHLLTNQPLYDDVSTLADLCVKILSEDPVPLLRRRPDLPPALAQLIHRALARQPEKRFPDVMALRQALLPFGNA